MGMNMINCLNKQPTSTQTTMHCQLQLVTTILKYSVIPEAVLLTTYRSLLGNKVNCNGRHTCIPWSTGGRERTANTNW